MTETITPPRPRGAVAATSPGKRHRSRHPRRRRALRILAVVALVALLSSAVWVAYFSTVLDTRQVSVSGTAELTPEQVRQAAAVSLGVPLARQDLNAVARRTTALAPVAAARVTRRWPHTVQVSITERQPLFGVPRGGSFLMVDAEGVVFATKPRLPDTMVRVEVDVTDRALLSELGSVVAALPPGLAQQVRVVRATSPDDVVVTLTSGVRVLWGDGRDSVLKAEVTQALLQQKPKRTVDVSSPQHPAIR